MSPLEYDRDAVASLLRPPSAPDVRPPQPREASRSVSYDTDTATEKLFNALRIVGFDGLRVTSGYRSEAENADTTGASPTSFHMQNLARDIAWDGLTDWNDPRLEQAAEAARRLGFREVIVEKHGTGPHLHVADYAPGTAAAPAVAAAPAAVAMPTITNTPASAYSGITFNAPSTPEAAARVLEPVIGPGVPAPIAPTVAAAPVADVASEVSVARDAGQPAPYGQIAGAFLDRVSQLTKPQYSPAMAPYMLARQVAPEYIPEIPDNFFQEQASEVRGQAVDRGATVLGAMIPDLAMYATGVGAGSKAVATIKLLNRIPRAFLNMAVNEATGAVIGATRPAKDAQEFIENTLVEAGFAGLFTGGEEALGIILNRTPNASRSLRTLMTEFEAGRVGKPGVSGRVSIDEESAIATWVENFKERFLRTGTVSEVDVNGNTWTFNRPVNPADVARVELRAPNGSTLKMSFRNDGRVRLDDVNLAPEEAAAAEAQSAQIARPAEAAPAAPPAVRPATPAAEAAVAPRPAAPAVPAAETGLAVQAPASPAPTPAAAPFAAQAAPQAAVSAAAAPARATISSEPISGTGLAADTPEARAAALRETVQQGTMDATVDEIELTAQQFDKAGDSEFAAALREEAQRRVTNGTATAVPGGPGERVAGAETVAPAAVPRGHAADAAINVAAAAARSVPAVSRVEIAGDGFGLTYHFSDGTSVPARLTEHLNTGVSAPTVADSADHPIIMSILKRGGAKVDGVTIPGTAAGWDRLRKTAPEQAQKILDGSQTLAVYIPGEGVQILRRAWDKPAVHVEELRHTLFAQLPKEKQRIVLKEYGNEENAVDAVDGISEPQTKAQKILREMNRGIVPDVANPQLSVREAAPASTVDKDAVRFAVRVLSDGVDVDVPQITNALLDGKPISEQSIRKYTEDAARLGVNSEAVSYAVEQFRQFNEILKNGTYVMLTPAPSDMGKVIVREGPLNTPATEGIRRERIDKKLYPVIQSGGRSAETGALFEGGQERTGIPSDIRGKQPLAFLNVPITQSHLQAPRPATFTYPLMVTGNPHIINFQRPLTSWDAVTKVVRVKPVYHGNEQATKAVADAINYANEIGARILVTTFRAKQPWTLARFVDFLPTDPKDPDFAKYWKPNPNQRPTDSRKFADYQPYIPNGDRVKNALRSNGWKTEREIYGEPISVEVHQDAKIPTFMRSERGTATYRPAENTWEVNLVDEMETIRTIKTKGGRTTPISSTEAKKMLGQSGGTWWWPSSKELDQNILDRINPSTQLEYCDLLHKGCTSCRNFQKLTYPEAAGAPIVGLTDEPFCEHGCPQCFVRLGQSGIKGRQGISIGRNAKQAGFGQADLGDQYRETINVLQSSVRQGKGRGVDFVARFLDKSTDDQMDIVMSLYMSGKIDANQLITAQREISAIAGRQPVGPRFATGPKTPEQRAAELRLRLGSEWKRRGFAETIERSVAAGEPLKRAATEREQMYYEVHHLNDTLEKADRLLATDPAAAREAVEAMKRGEVEAMTDVNNAIAQRIIVDLQAKGQISEAIDLAENLSTRLTQAGQFTAAARIWSRLSPDTVVITATRAAQSAGKKLTPEQATRIREQAVLAQDASRAAEKQLELELMQEQGADLRRKNNLAQRKLDEAQNALANTRADNKVLRDKLAQDIREMEAKLEEAQRKLEAVQAGIEKAQAQRAAHPRTKWTPNADYTQLQRVADAEKAKLLRDLAEITPPSLADKAATYLAIAQLLNFKTMARNLIGNTLFLGAENVSKVLAAAIDSGLSVATGKRTITLPSARAQATGGASAVQTALTEVYEGVNLDRFDETSYGVKSRRAFVPKPEQGLLRRTAENVGRTAEIALGFWLRVPDRAFYGAAFADSVLDQLWAKAKNEKWEDGATFTVANRIDLMLKQIARGEMISPELQAIIDRARFESDYRIFNDTNLLTEASGMIKTALNLGRPFGLGNLLYNYPKVPANLVNRMAAYSPIGFINSAYHLGRMAFKQPFAQRDFAQSASRAIVGSTFLTGLGAVLAAVGIATIPSEDENYNIRTMRQAVGLGPFRINVSAFQRWILNGMPMKQNAVRDLAKEGDLFVTYDWAQPLSGSFAMGSRIWQMTTDKEKRDRMTADLDDKEPGSFLSKMSAVAEFFGVDVMLSSLETIAEQPMVAGAMRIPSNFARIQNQEDPGKAIAAAIGETILNVIEAVPASLVPTILYQHAQVFDNAARERWAPDAMTRALNQMQAKIPIWSSFLPQQNVLGEPKLRYMDGDNTLFNVFLNPAFANRYYRRPEAELLQDVWAYAKDNQATLAQMRKKITSQGQTYPMSTQEWLDANLDTQRTAVRNLRPIAARWENMDERQRESGSARFAEEVVKAINEAESAARENALRKLRDQQRRQGARP